jgi:hypothetical protein
MSQTESIEHTGSPQELIDQSFRGVDDVFGAWERAAFDIVDIVPETIDSLCVDLLLHLVASVRPARSGATHFRRSRTEQSISSFAIACLKIRRILLIPALIVDRHQPASTIFARTAFSANGPKSFAGSIP